MRLVIGSDHAGFEYKAEIVEKLNKKGHVVKDVGPYNTDSVDYPDYAHPLASLMESGDYDLGILLCGSGNGVCITANKHKNIRAALCWKPQLASLARQHNDANVLCLPSRFISKRTAHAIVNAFLDTPFEGGRHLTRVQKIDCV